MQVGLFILTNMFKKTLLCLSIICGYSSNYNIASAMEGPYTYLFNKEIRGRYMENEKEIEKKAYELDNSGQTYDENVDNLFAWIKDMIKDILNTKEKKEKEEKKKEYKKYVFNTDEHDGEDMLYNFIRLLNRYDVMMRKNPEYWFISKAYDRNYDSVYSPYSYYFDNNNLFRKDCIFSIGTIWDKYLSLLCDNGYLSEHSWDCRCGCDGRYDDEPAFWYMGTKSKGFYFRYDDFDNFFSVFITYLEEHSSKKGCYLLDGDMFHLFLANFLFNKKLLTRSDRNFYFGSKNFYEALIVTVMKYKLSSLSLDELLFGKKGEEKYKIVNFDIYSYYSHHLDLLHKRYSHCRRDYFSNDFLVSGKTKMTPKGIRKKFNYNYNDNNTKIISPVRISEINKETCLDPAWFGNISNNTSNLQKVLESFNFFKLKFDFEFTETELNIISKPREESIADFFDCIFEKANDYILEKGKSALYYDYNPDWSDSEDNKSEDHDEEEGYCYIEWCIDVIKKFVKCINNFKSCNIFPYIDKAIRNSDKFLRNFLNAFISCCYHNKPKLLELQKALLDYYANEISDAKLNIIREWENEINSIK